MNAKEVFLRASEINSPDERAAYVTSACDGDASLRHQVDALLAANDDPDSFLDHPAVDLRHAKTESRIKQPAADAQAPPEKTGTRIDKYKLLQEIGHGGFGVVYMAEQLEPVRRQVALKIIKPGMDTREVIARFEAERQALALMDHPNIAKVLDAGATSSGRPYFVMELVKGVPITDFCDKNSLTTHQRLELFSRVCQAVHHAHQKGVIHRDIKPSNVMVTLHDGKPVPKVIDFGISKAISQRLTEKTFFTRYGQMIGTPQYMSPEQAEMSGLDVDTRSDVYSLGVLLYELLTGTTPLATERLRTASYAELLRMIQEADAPVPSTRLSTLSDRLTVICRQRSTNERQLSKLIRGELDWIVMKALDKDRTRRYESAHAFAADIERHLRDEPVQAGAPSRLHLLRRTIRRHRGLFAVGSAIALSLFIGLGLATYGLATARVERAAAIEAAADARHARRDADRQREQAEQQRDAAEESQLLAETAARRSESTLSLLTDMLASARPGSERGYEYTVRELLKEVAEQVEIRLADDPEAQMTIHAVLGKTYEQLKEIEKGQFHLKRALSVSEQLFGTDHPTYLENMTALHYVLMKQDAADKTKLEESAKDVIRKFAEMHRKHEGLLDATYFLALLYERTGRWDESAELADSIVNSTDSYSDSVNVRHRFAAAHALLGRLIAQRCLDRPIADAIRHAESSLALFATLDDPNRAGNLVSKIENNLSAGYAHHCLSNMPKAMEHYTSAIKNLDNAFKELGVWVGECKTTYVRGLIDNSEYGQAVEYVHSLMSQHDSHSSPHESSEARQAKAYLAEYQCDFETAEKHRQLERDQMIRLKGLTAIESHKAILDYAVCLDLQGKRSDADTIYGPLLLFTRHTAIKYVAEAKRPLPLLAEAVSWILANYGGASAEDLQLAQRVSAELLGPYQGTPHEVLVLLTNGVANLRLERVDIAKIALKKAMTLRWPHLRAYRRRAEDILVKVLTERSEFDELEQFYKEQIAACADRIGGDHLETLGLQVRYAEFLQDQRQDNNQAEKLLLEAYESATGADFMSRAVRSEAQAEIVELYRATGRSNLADEWSAKEAETE